MAAAFVSRCGARLIGGLVASPSARPPEWDSTCGLDWVQSAHPTPDEASAEAGRRALAIAASVPRDGSLVLLLSGGASSLLAAPADGIALESKQALVRAMLLGGADIAALNAARKHLSAIKGGRLAAQCAGRTLTLAISDVVGDDLSVIGSGPGVPDPSTWRDAANAVQRFARGKVPPDVSLGLDQGLRGERADTPKPGDPSLARASAQVIGSRQDALDAAAALARQRGYKVTTLDQPVTGQARTAALHWWTRAVRELEGEPGPLCLLSGGETTVHVTGSGRGGRNQEFALALLEPLAATRRALAVASVGTDGIDGPTDAAGAVADPGTLTRARAGGAMPVAEALANNDAYRFFASVDGLIRTGATDTNVGDVQILLAASRD